MRLCDGLLDGRLLLISVPEAFARVLDLVETECVRCAMTGSIELPSTVGEGRGSRDRGVA